MMNLSVHFLSFAMSLISVSRATTAPSSFLNLDASKLARAAVLSATSRYLQKSWRTAARRASGLTLTVSHREQGYVSLIQAAGSMRMFAYESFPSVSQFPR